MKLEPNMYVRTKKGTIYKFETNNSMAKNGAKKYMVNCSYNIIDLIQVGDYVNGYPVYETIEYPDNTRAIVIADDYKSVIWEESPQYIKSIVTKEMFENMSYEVE